MGYRTNAAQVQELEQAEEMLKHFQYTLSRAKRDLNDMRRLAVEYGVEIPEGFAQRATDKVYGR